MKIHLTLKTLMQMKSERDGATFTFYQLAKALNIPHSVLSRLTHSQPDKRVNNPRIDTLFKIVEFFKIDGFNITINDLLMGFEEDAVNIQEQTLASILTKVKLPLYSFNLDQPQKMGMATVKLAAVPNNVIAFLSDEAIPPLFKPGSIFIVDRQLQPQEDSLVAVKLKTHLKVLIKKLHIKRNKKWFKSIEKNDAELIALEEKYYSIIGVIIQINAKN